MRLAKARQQQLPVTPFLSVAPKETTVGHMHLGMQVVPVIWRGYVRDNAFVAVFLRFNFAWGCCSIITLCHCQVRVGSWRLSDLSRMYLITGLDNMKIQAKK